MNKSLSIPLYIFYQFLKALVLISFGIFYSRRKIINGERLKFRNSAIVVSNHPNTLMDVLTVASSTRKVVYFLANAGLFGSSFGKKLFDFMYCIPIERPQDVQGRRINNEASFARCDEFLTGGGVLFIAPQGGSEMMWRIGKIKTGAARIALSAESKNDYKLDLIIVPSGLTYNAPSEFRSQMMMKVGAPIRVADYKELYETDSSKAIKKLTADIKAAMGDLVLDTESEADEKILREIIKIKQSETPLKIEPAFDRGKKIAGSLALFNQQRPVAYQALQQQSDDYFKKVEKHKITDASLIHFVKEKIVSFSYLLIALPLFLIGLINHIIPNGIPWLVNKKLNLYPGYTATVKSMLGLFTYPLFYGLQVFIVRVIAGSWWIALAYLLLLFPLGWFTNDYLKKYDKWKKENKVKQFKKEDPAAFDQLLEDREALKDSIDKAID